MSVLRNVTQWYGALCFRPRLVLVAALFVVGAAGLRPLGRWIWRTGWEPSQPLFPLLLASRNLSGGTWWVVIGTALMLGTVPAFAFGWKTARTWWCTAGGLGLLLTAGPHSSWEVRLILWSGPLLVEYFQSQPMLGSAYPERFATFDEMRGLLADRGGGELRCAVLAGTVWHRRRWRRQASWVVLRPTPRRPEIGHGLVVAPTGLGKGLAIVSQLLQNTCHSVIVLDLKGEAYRLTSGARVAAGHRILRLDLSGGHGHRYDPTAQAQDEDEMRVIAQALTHDPRDRDPFWAQAAEEVLTVCMLAARRGGHPVFPFVRVLLDQGVRGAIGIVREIDPVLAARFLPGGRAENKMTLGVWMTLVARLRPLLTDRLLAVLGGSDFTASDLRSQRTTVYITVPEAHLERLAPALAAVWTGLTADIIAHADANPGVGLRPLLLMLDEAGRIPIPHLSGYLATLRSRGVTCLVYAQSFSQLREKYGPDQAHSISNNCALQVYYQQHDEATAWMVSQRLGDSSGLARGHSVTETTLIPGFGTSTWTGTERPRPLMSPQEIMRLPEHTVLVFYRDLRPMWIGRLDWREHYALRELAAIPVVDLPRLTPWAGVFQKSPLSRQTGTDDEYLDPDR